MDEDRQRFVELDLHLTQLMGGEVTFQSDQGPGEHRLAISETAWRQWGCPVSVAVTVDTEQDG